MKKVIPMLILIFGISQNLFAQEESKWRGPDRNGVYPSIDLLREWPKEGPELLWRFDELGKGYSTVAVYADQLFTIGTIDSISYIFSFERSGKLRWKKELGPEFMSDFPGIRATPTIINGYGYILNGIGVLYCFDTKTGNIHWSKDIVKEFKGKYSRFGISESLVIDEDKVFCTPGGTEANIVALNRFTGELIWKCPGNGEMSTYSSSTLVERGGSKFLIAVTEKTMMAIHANTGNMVSKYKLIADQHTNTPLYKDGILLTVDGGQACMALKISESGLSVDVVWQNEHVIVVQGDAVLINDNIIAYSSKEKTLYAINGKTGTELSSIKLSDKHQLASVIAADNMIYCYTFWGTMMLFDLSEGKLTLKSTFDLPTPKKEHCSYPVINKGVLYVRYNNSLLAYNISKTNRKDQPGT